MLSYILSYIPGTKSYYRRTLELERLSDEWERSSISYYKVKRACEIMNDFHEEDCVINEDTTKRLEKISQECLDYTLAKHLKLDNMKTLLHTWEGENVDIVRVNVYEYVEKLRKIDDDLVFYESIEEFVEKYLGEELYERLETVIRFFKQLDNLRRTLA